MTSASDTYHETATEGAGRQRCGDAGAPHAAGGNPPAPGAPPSNTAPGNCTESTQILRVGVDSLYLSYPGDLSTEATIRLAELKALAQSKNPEAAKLAQYAFGHHLFEVQDRGRHPFAYILRDRWYRIEVSGPSAASAPLVHAQIASEALTFEGPSAVEQDLSAVASSLGAPGAPNVSRADLCVDFVTDHLISAVQEREWVTRARKFDRYSVDRHFTGWAIGAGGDLSARLYNKSLEIRESGKDYMQDIWRDLGWDGQRAVWRLEFQFRRDVLRQLKCRDFELFLSSLGGLWRYAALQWLRLAIPSDTDTTQSRWPTHPLWEVLQAANWQTEQAICRRQQSTGRLPGDRSLFINGLSGLTSFMAREGIVDPYEGAKAYFIAARKFHEDQSHYTGLSFEDYIDQRVSLKAKRFNSMKNVPSDGGKHPADRAVAREYRRLSDGE